MVTVAPKAPHVPATPAPWYATLFSDLKAPRTPNYNASKEELASDIDDASTSFRVHSWTLMGSADPFIGSPLGVSSKLPLPLYADVRLHIPMTHNNDVGRPPLADCTAGHYHNGAG